MDWLLSSLLYEQPTFRNELLALLAERAARPELARHLFEYNIHEVTIDFEKGDVLIDSIIYPEELRMTLSELLEALGLPGERSAVGEGGIG